MSRAQDLIAQLGLQPHPEGGWYRETWRAPSAGGERAGGTAIHFLLEAGQASHWHRVDAAEIWLWHAGDPVELRVAPEGSDAVSAVLLGGDPLTGQAPQHVIPERWWQAARPLAGAHGYALVSCVVVPGFDFAGFELAAPGWEPA